MTTLTVTRPDCPELRQQQIATLLKDANDHEARGCPFEARRLRRIAAGMTGHVVIDCSAQSGSTIS
jgi:hypothetical protein